MRQFILLSGLLFLLSGLTAAEAQGGLTKIKQKIKDKVSQRADDKTDQAIDKTLDKTEDIGKTKTKSKTEDNNANETNMQGPAVGSSNLKAYSKYDFVAGDKIIFQDNLQEEKEGEFPSQFASGGGQGQVFTFNGENVFQTLADETVVTPRIKGMNYLPEQFTVEFDAYIEGDGEEMIVKFAGVEEELSLYGTNAGFGKFTGEVPKEVADQWYAQPSVYGWRHYAIAVNKTLMKAYIDQFRVLNMPSLDGKPTSVSFSFRCSSSGSGDCKNMFIKNIRIAAGGIDVYKKVESDGKIVTHGITFDIDKATIKPESMGTINQIYDLLKKNASLKFEIDGHTDNSGTPSHNLSLSQQRADAVKAELTKMGIDGARLSTKGLGDTKPLSENNTPEGRANNRRVEFIKI